MSFEISSLALEDQAELHLKHPVTEVELYAPVKKGEDAESKPVTIVLKGSASQAFAKAIDATIAFKRKLGNREMSPKQAREQNIEFLVALSVTANNLTLDGEPVDNPEAFRKLYSDAKYDWIKAQVNDFLNSAEHFLK